LKLELLRDRLDASREVAHDERKLMQMHHRSSDASPARVDIEAAPNERVGYVN
jgi:hypothetical protein